MMVHSTGDYLGTNATIQTSTMPIPGDLVIATPLPNNNNAAILASRKVQRRKEHHNSLAIQSIPHTLSLCS